MMMVDDSGGWLEWNSFVCYRYVCDFNICKASLLTYDAMQCCIAFIVPTFSRPL